MWEVEITDEFTAWFFSLSVLDKARIEDRVSLLEMHGPGLRRPAVGEITGSRHPNMKELRVSSLRVLFAFDPRSMAILLIGGDKAAAGWNAWYSTAIKEADALYDQYLDELRDDGLI